MPRVLIPLPDRDFDPTEVATPWDRLAREGHDVVFATEAGEVAAADPLLLTGVLFGRLGAKPASLEQYARMLESDAFRRPIRYADIDAPSFDAIVLPGGHAPGMKQYLESTALRKKVLEFMKRDKLVAAICHGVLVLARTQDPLTGRSVLFQRRVTALLKVLERTGYFLTFWKLGSYYRTYPAYVEDEIKAALQPPQQFLAGPAPWIPFVVRDGSLITARWPEDAERFAAAILGGLAAATEPPD